MVYNLKFTFSVASLFYSKHEKKVTSKNLVYSAKKTLPTQAPGYQNNQLSIKIKFHVTKAFTKINKKTKVCKILPVTFMTLSSVDLIC